MDGYPKRFRLVSQSPTLFYGTAGGPDPCLTTLQKNMMESRSSLQTGPDATARPVCLPQYWNLV